MSKQKICSYCFELVLPNEKAERIRLPDGSEITIHSRCLEDMMEEQEKEGIEDERGKH